MGSRKAVAGDGASNRAVIDWTIAVGEQVSQFSEDGRLRPSCAKRAGLQPWHRTQHAARTGRTSSRCDVSGAAWRPRQWEPACDRHVKHRCGRLSGLPDACGHCVEIDVPVTADPSCAAATEEARCTAITARCLYPNQHPAGLHLIWRSTPWRLMHRKTDRRPTRMTRRTPSRDARQRASFRTTIPT